MRQRGRTWQEYFEEGTGLTMAAMFSAGMWFILGYMLYRGFR